MTLRAAITHLSSAVHGAGAGVAVLGEGRTSSLFERLEKQAGRRRAAWDTGSAVDDGEGGATTTRWRVSMLLRVAFVLTDEQGTRRAMTEVMAKLAAAIRDAQLDAAAAAAGIVSLVVDAPRPEAGAPEGAAVMALPVTMRIRGPL